MLPLKHTHTIDLSRIICWVTSILPLEHHSRWKLQPLGQVFFFLFNASQLPCHIFLSLIDTQTSAGAQYSIIRLLLQTDPYPPLIGVSLLRGPQLCLANAAALPLCTEASLRSPLVLSSPHQSWPYITTHVCLGHIRRDAATVNILHLAGFLFSVVCTMKRYCLRCSFSARSSPGRYQML